MDCWLKKLCKNAENVLPSSRRAERDDCPCNHVTFVLPPSAYIPNYEIVKEDLKFGKAEECHVRPRLLFLNDDKYETARRQIPRPDKRLLNIPCRRQTRWNNYCVQPKHFLYTDSWREDCKIPDNWHGQPPFKDCSSKQIN